MENIVIIGASGLGRELWTIVNSINEKKKTYNVVGFYDDAFIEEYHVI
jgi:hypothetical protein